MMKPHGCGSVRIVRYNPHGEGLFLQKSRFGFSPSWDTKQKRRKDYLYLIFVLLFHSDKNLFSLIHDKFIGNWCFPKDDSLMEQSARRGVQYDFGKIGEEIIDKVHFHPEDVVLDVCCGNAVLAKQISKTCREVHGVDYSEHLITSAKNIKEKENIPNLHLHLSDAMNIDKLFKEDFFDKSYCYFSFQYFNRHRRELLLEKLSRITTRNGWIFLGDIPDKTRMNIFYSSPIKYYREKISRLIQFKEGECNLGWWVDPKEIVDWGEKRRMGVSIMHQGVNMPHARYRFDAMIRNSK